MLGIIFFIIILLVGYILIRNPFNIRSIIFNTEQEDTSSISADLMDVNPILSDSQEKTLRTIGIDPADIPSQFTPEQEKCFREKIGSSRVDEIIAGDSPSVTEFLKAQGCL